MCDRCAVQSWRRHRARSAWSRLQSVLSKARRAASMGCVHVLGGALRGEPDDGFGGWGDDLEGAAGSGDEAAVDEQLRTVRRGSGPKSGRHTQTFPLCGHQNAVVSRHMSSNGVESTRRRLSAKQAETVDRLTVAAVEVIREREFGGLTIREVASRAGVGAATAYTYFSSKEHLVAEIFWRRLRDSVEPDVDGLDRTGRVLAVLRNIALLYADEPEVSAAVTNALLGKDPDVEHLRGRIGGDIRRRLVGALSPDVDDAILDALEMIYAGALLRAGMGYDSYTTMADKLGAAARLILEAR